MNKRLNAIKNTGYITIALSWLYIIASYIDIIAHNTSDYNYAWWNLFYNLASK